MAGGSTGMEVGLRWQNAALCIPPVEAGPHTPAIGSWSFDVQRGPALCCVQRGPANVTNLLQSVHGDRLHHGTSHHAKQQSTGKSSCQPVTSHRAKQQLSIQTSKRTCKTTILLQVDGLGLEPVLACRPWPQPASLAVSQQHMTPSTPQPFNGDQQLQSARALHVSK